VNFRDALQTAIRIRRIHDRSFGDMSGAVSEIYATLEVGGVWNTVGPCSAGRPEFPKKKSRYCKISGTARLSLQVKLIRNSENQFATARFPVLCGPVLQGRQDLELVVDRQDRNVEASK